MSKLTPKQELFVLEYLKDFNATQAAIRAGYSEKSAEVIGHENLRKPNIREAIKSAKIERTERVKIDADWVMQRLAEESFADINDLFDDNGDLRPVKDWPKVWRTGLIAGIDVTTVGDTLHRVTKIRLSDRLRRIELLGKHVDVQAFRERVDVHKYDHESALDQLDDQEEHERSQTTH
jgi:phage terminase small subunit